MSESQKRRAQSKAKDADASAAAWLDKRDRGGWTEEDEAAFEAWLDEEPIHRIAYWRMEETWERTERLAALNLPRAQAWKGPSLFRIAAVLALVIAAATASWTYHARPRGANYATSIGGRETIMLADGTSIELNTDSAVRVLDTTVERKIWLEKGEAFFKVTHDAKRPLTVYVDERRITDLGTQFDVHSETGRLEVAVVEGRVRFEAGQAQSAEAPVVLGRGDVALATADKMFRSQRAESELARELSWRRGVLVFDSTPLSEAVRQLNRYNQTRIALADSAIGQLPITGTLSATEPMEFLRMVQTVFGLHEQRVNGAIVISR